MLLGVEIVFVVQFFTLFHPFRSQLFWWREQVWVTFIIWSVAGTQFDILKSAFFSPVLCSVTPILNFLFQISLFCVSQPYGCWTQMLTVEHIMSCDQDVILVSCLEAGKKMTPNHWDSGSHGTNSNINCGLCVSLIWRVISRGTLLCKLHILLH